MKKYCDHKISQRLHHKIQFLQNISKDEIEKEVWQTKILTFAEVKPISDTKFTPLENMDFGHLMTEAYFIFKLRYVRNIVLDMRILFKDRLFEIKRIINVAERDKLLQIIALEII